ncbi:hypothetical protein BJV78DRAFT_1282907 [Lactifluus subvellereus]|nr:hypothetical protein BJV78DRAFT_1282907 [Lactifluus subvellereus]
MPVSSFPNPVPSGTRVPQWALLDVTVCCSIFFFGTSVYQQYIPARKQLESFAVGDSPEPTPGMVISPTPTHTHNSSGAIAGGVVGGVAAIAVAGLAIFFWLRRKRPQDPSAAFVVDGVPQPLMGEVWPPGSNDGTHGPSSMPETPASPMMLYDPNDPITFSGFQGAVQVHAEVPVAPYSGNTQANILTSPPPEYHSLPTV